VFLSSQNTVNPGTLKAIIIIDNKNPNINDTKISKSIEANKDIVNGFLQNMTDTRVMNLRIELLEGSDVSLENIKNALRELKINRGDILLFYYSGFREYKDNQLNFILSEDEIMESESLERLLNAYGSRLTLLIDDCVNDINLEAGVYDESSIDKTLTKDNNTAYRNLLYNYKGIMHFSSCEKEQASLMTKNGGIFTETLFSDVLLNSSETTWKETIEEVKTKTTEKFEEWHNKLNDEKKEAIKSHNSGIQKPIQLSLPQKIISDTTVIKFSDKILEKALRNIVGIKRGRVRYRDIEYMDGLYLSGYNIEDISVMKYFVQLEEIDFSRNQIHELTPLEELYQLQNLNLEENVIKNVKPLQNLTQLKSLSLGNNQIKEIIYLDKLKNLDKLNLSRNLISDVTPLQDLYKLETLYLYSNQIEDAQPLSHLTEIHSLSIADNNISDGSFLNTLTKLRKLDINRNQISDLSPLNTLTNLKLLNITQNNIENISALKGLSSIEKLYASSNNISDISALSGITTIKKLGLSLNKIKDISPLMKLNRLEVISLGKNEIEDISALSNMITLQDISLGGNKLKDVTPLLELYNNGGFQKEDVYYFVNIEDNNLDLRAGTSNRKAIDTLIHNGVDLRWVRGNVIR